MNALTLIHNEILSTGSTWVREDKLFKKKYAAGISKYELESLLYGKKLIRREIDNFIYYSLPFYNKLEWDAAKDVFRIQENYVAPNVSDEYIETLIRQAELLYGISLHEQQKAAVFGAVKSGVFIITGGPGTGKTCVLKVLLYVLTNITYGIDIRMTAPTGKAARRITESTGRSAKTVQKELRITETKRTPDKLHGNVLIIDEVSMLDMETAAAVFKSVQNGQKCILVGDIDQLPSVGPGAVLRDLIDSGAVPFVMLTKTFRQANDSTLFGNIQKIKNGEYPFSVGDDFFIYEAEINPIDKLLELYLSEKDLYGVENVALLLPYRKKGDLCSNNLNNIIQSAVNPIGNKKHVTSVLDDGRKVSFSVGDPVMQLENRDECVNGDVGMVVDVCGSVLTVDYTGTLVQYTPQDLVKQLSLAYSMSVNKSQGSEYKSVIMGLTEAHKCMLNRNLLYTGVTRAKQKLTLLHDESATCKALWTDGTYVRETFFADDLAILAERR